ncbi:glycosyltransferase family 2 protein [Natrialbaceae archaeon GCM10025810]|uniref:glycosyltransferase family 2 protein n=1 Tax=Halovalidus salilacus TaxID=3075124 RepID=UPI00361F0199
MYQGKTIGVVVTAYNEEAFVGEVIETTPEFVDRIYAVDDASPDGSWEVIRRVADRVNGAETTAPELAVTDGGETDARRVVPIRHEENRGYGAAVKTGYRRALEDGLDVVAVMNGDGQMPPEILDRIVEPVVRGEADYAKGNRLLRPEDRTDMSRFRFVGNALLSGLSKFASGYWSISDPQNGYTAISRETIETLDLDALTDKYGFLNHILTHLNVHEFRVTDVEMTAVYGDEESSIRYVPFVRYVSLLLLRSFLWRLKSRYVVRRFHPAVLLYGAGTAGLIGGTLGLVGSIAASIGRSDPSEAPDREPTDGRTRTGSARLVAATSAFLTTLVGLVSLAEAISKDAAESEDLEMVHLEGHGGEGREEIPVREKGSETDDADPLERRF